MRKARSLFLIVVFFAGCATTPSQEADSHSGAVVGGAGGALAGGAMAYSSAGILCTIGGPLCVAFILPAALIGGAVGLAAGSVVDAVGNSKKKEETAKAGEAPPPADTSAPPGG